MPFTTETPVFKHDCEDCEFLGGIMNDGFRWDIYTCMTAIGRTVICRYGDAGEEYLSSPVKFLHQPWPDSPVMRAAMELHNGYNEYFGI